MIAVNSVQSGAGTGFIYTSTDSGATWVQRLSAGQKNWGAVASSANGLNLIAAEIGGGYLYTSSDAGVTWTQRTSAGSRSWISVSSSADGSMLAATGYVTR